MEQRLANSWHMTVNEKNFIETVLLSDLRVDDRGPLDYRPLTIKFGSEDGSSEVQLGQTHVMAFVTAQLVQPYRDRPNEGSLSIYTEFSPMADPSFEAGRPGESSIELSRIIERGLRESRAVDTESLCVLTGKSAWSVRVDIHILDNGGNLVDAANVAALVALMTYRRPDCTVGGEEDRQEVIIHPPEVEEPLPLIIHHLPIAITFAFMTDNNIVVIDPTHYEEAIMKGRLTTTVNTSGDICSIQKAGGIGVMQSVIMQCFRIAAEKAVEITSNIRNAVESYNKERAIRKIKCHSPSDFLIVNPSRSTMDEPTLSKCEEREREHQIEDSVLQGRSVREINQMKSVECSSRRKANSSIEAKSSLRGPSSWDPYLKGVNRDLLRISLSSHGKSVPTMKENEGIGGNRQSEGDSESVKKETPLRLAADVSEVAVSNRKAIKTLKDAVKPKDKRKKNVSSTANTS